MSNKFAKALAQDKPSEGKVMDSKPGTSVHDRPARQGTKHVGGYFLPEVSKQLRQIALDEETSVQQLLGEALDMLFQSRKVPTIAQKKAAE